MEQEITQLQSRSLVYGLYKQDFAEAGVDRLLDVEINNLNDLVLLLQMHATCKEQRRQSMWFDNLQSEIKYELEQRKVESETKTK